MTAIALFGAGGKMGARLSRNLKASDYAVRHVEPGEAGRARLAQELGIACVDPATALDAVRQQRGATGVSVSVTPVAQRCAASGGAQCPGQYAVQTAGAQDGRAAIAALAASDGNAWLFAAQTTTLQVGWAYLPSLHQYVLALLAG